MADADLPPVLQRFKTIGYADALNRWFSNARMATFMWCAFTASYWTLLVLIPGIIKSDLNSYKYYIWFVGMIGVCSVYYSTRADFPADSYAGKPIIAITCLLIAVDLTAHSLAALQWNDVSVNEFCIMLGHSLSILWASLFFYNRAIKNGRKIAWLSLLLQWLDIVFMCIVVLVLHSKEGECLSMGICIGYFAVLTVNMFAWFFPIMFGFSDTEKHIHLHMVILDSCTDLPLVVTVILTEGYNIHWFLFIDIAFKIIMLLRTYAYHLLLNLILRKKELDELQKHQTEQLELQNRLFEEGASGEEIDAQTIELVKRQSAPQGGVVGDANTAVR